MYITTLERAQKRQVALKLRSVQHALPAYSLPAYSLPAYKKGAVNPLTGVPDGTRWRCCCVTDSQPHQANAPVVVLHGLLRGPASMRRLAQALAAAGYSVTNAGYPSRSAGIEALAEQVLGPLVQAQSPAHFVTHSLGGILLRAWVHRHGSAGIGRVVMLGPPNAGSNIVDRLGHWPGFALINGPAGRQLGTGADQLPRQLGPATFELGVIAGTRSAAPLLGGLLPAPHDGRVSVASTRLDGMCAHLVLPVSHTFMMRAPEVLRQVCAFLATGAFVPSDQPRGSTP